MTRTGLLLLPLALLASGGGPGGVSTGFRADAPPADRPPRTLLVGGAGGAGSISAALAAARPGDTIRVRGGTYRERLRVTQEVTLLGSDRPVVDAGGEGHVVEATAPLTLRGFELRGSGTSVDREHAGVMVRGAPAVVEDNVLRDVFYGIYLKDAAGSVVRGNRIVGKPLAMPRRGDGIRLWYSSGTRIVGNHVRRTRDMVVYFSDSLRIRDNSVADGRYGLHYMYSDHNEFRHNRFSNNQVGSFIMYSRDVRLEENVFARARGASGMGLGLKDADEIVAVGNLFVGNQSGVYIDNSPRTAALTNRFRGNLFVQNGSAVRMLPSVAGNRFTGNSFVANTRPAEVSGGVRRGVAAQNEWRGNHWSDYAGFDRDDDGRGDTPFVYAKLSDDLMSRHETMRLYGFSPVMPVLETVSRFFPMLRPRPVVVDSTPVLEGGLLAAWQRSPPVAEAGFATPGGSGASGEASSGTLDGAAGGSRAASVGWAVLALAAGAATWRLGRRRA